MLGNPVAVAALVSDPSREEVVELEYEEGDEVDAAMRQEDEEDARVLARRTAIIAEIMRDSGDLIVVQGEAILVADEATEEAVTSSAEAVQEIEKARKSWRKERLWKGVLIGACIGGVVGFPLGAGLLIGAASSAAAHAGGVGLLGSFVGSIVGGTSAYAVEKSKE